MSTDRKHLYEIANRISSGRGAHCYGTGWEVRSVDASVSYTNDIKVTAYVKITADWVIATDSSRAGADRDIRNGVNSYVKEKVEEYTCKHPDISLDDIRINVKIHIS